MGWKGECRSHREVNQGECHASWRQDPLSEQRDQPQNRNDDPDQGQAQSGHVILAGQLEHQGVDAVSHRSALIDGVSIRSAAFEQDVGGDGCEPFVDVPDRCRARPGRRHRTTNSARAETQSRWASETSSDSPAKLTLQGSVSWGRRGLAGGIASGSSTHGSAVCADFMAAGRAAGKPGIHSPRLSGRRTRAPAYRAR